jgi:hypothetical protein
VRVLNYRPLQTFRKLPGIPRQLAAVVLQARRHGSMIPPIPAANFNVNAADAAWVDMMSVPQPLATFVQGVRGGVESPAVVATNRSYLFATANGGDWFVSTHARLKDHPQWKVHTLPCGHNIMLDRPAEMTSLLLAEVTRRSVIEPKRHDGVERRTGDSAHMI